jgi:hypothetical protein
MPHKGVHQPRGALAPYTLAKNDLQYKAAAEALALTVSTGSGGLGRHDPAAVARLRRRSLARCARGSMASI